MERSRFTLAAFPLVLSGISALLLAGCGGGGGTPAVPQQPAAVTPPGNSGPTATPNPTASPNSTASPAPSSTPAATVSMSVTSADTAAATKFASLKYHVLPTEQKRSAPAGRALRPQAVNYPGDLTNFGGAVIARATNYNIYINCRSTCWGNPQAFIDRLDNSSYVHIADQYVGSTANGRYGFGTNIAVSEPTYTNYLSQGDLVAIVHAAASRFGSGYNHIYNVFLPQGVDTCFEETTQCYSPDNPSATQFCAYHASGSFNDGVGHVVFTVLPYQDVGGCQILGGPNSSLVDSTASAIAHEFMETITDPDTGGGWYNLNFNMEISDLCALYNDVDNVDGTDYLIQEQYSNKIHACTNV